MLLLDPLALPVIAHRGASGEYPENTVLAFNQALRMGADALELDVRVSADNVPVVIHDPTVERTTNGSGLVKQKQLAELNELDAGCGEAVPTLNEVLELFPETPLIIEIKEAAAAAVVRETLEAHRAVSRVLVGSSESRAMRQFHTGGFNRCANRSQTTLFWMFSRARLTYHISADAFCIPERQGSTTVVDERFMSSVGRVAMPVHVWTVDSVATAHSLWEMGVRGIITNRPDVIRNAREGKYAG